MKTLKIINMNYFIKNTASIPKQMIFLLHEYVHLVLELVSFANKSITKNEAIVELLVYMILHKFKLGELNNEHHKFLGLKNLITYWEQENNIAQKLNFINRVLEKVNEIYTQIQKTVDLKSKLNKKDK